MYAPFFGLQQEAFSIAPDPRFLHLSAMHREALAHLLYGLQAGGGFVLLTGEIGTGKTTVCRCFLEQMPPGHTVAYLYNPKLSPVELLQTVAQEFGIALPTPLPESIKPLVDAINQHLLQTHADGGQCLLVVDEAQALSAELLEQLRLLTNLETNERKLLQIVLIGQPELRSLLARPELEQLAQRVVARVHLGPLNEAETADYVSHRLSVAGLNGPSPFDAAALRAVHRISGGVPRRINLLCQRALLGAYAQGQHHIGAALVRQAAREVFDGEGPARRPAFVAAFGRAGLGALRARPALAAGAALLLAAAVAGGGWLFTRTAGGPAALAAASAPGNAGSAGSADRAGAAAGSGTNRTAPAAFADASAATAALAAAWTLDAAGEADACRAAGAHGLACQQGKGDLALLRKLQRPALLQTNGGGSLLLQGLDTHEARLLGPDGERRLSAAALAEAWTGSYTTWWRPPPGWQPGERVSGEAAAWVLDRLAALQGDARGGNRDELLRQRVFAFQLAQGLALDGVAGPLTLMQINRAAGIDEPLLKAKP